MNGSSTGKSTRGKYTKPSDIDQAIDSVLESRAHQGQLTENVSAANEDYTLDIPSNVDVAPQNVDIYQRQTMSVNERSLHPRNLYDVTIQSVKHLLLIDQLFLSTSMTDMEYTAKVFELLVTIFAPKTCEEYMAIKKHIHQNALASS